jgi:DNA-binding transcriptional ArsR family regulator
MACRPLSSVVGSAPAELSSLAAADDAAVASAMVAAANLVEVAALVGTARATILAALMGGQALTGSELAFLARISRPTASEHLVKLTEAGALSLLPHRVAARGADGRKHHRGRCHRGSVALSAALDPRQGAAFRAHLL